MAPLPPGTSFYQRRLPDACIAFSSEVGRTIFAEALAEGHMRAYFALAEQFHTQSEPAFCGLGTLVMVLNALQVDPKRTWKGPWRWFSESMLDCCVAQEVARAQGITMAQFACLGECNGAHVERFDADACSLEDFRKQVTAACQATHEPLVVNYSRKGLGQTGDGHFSPVGGYNAQRDMVLILDLARFKHPPHWVPLAMLFAAMQRPDSVTQRARGFAVVRRRDAPSFHVTRLFAPVVTLRQGKASWGGVIADTLRCVCSATEACADACCVTADALVRVAVRAMREEMRRTGALLTRKRLAVHAAEAAEQHAILTELRAHALCAAVRAAWGEEGGEGEAEAVENVAMLLLACPVARLIGCAGRALVHMEALRELRGDGPLRDEVDALRRQVKSLLALHEGGVAEEAAAPRAPGECCDCSCDSGAM